ALRDYVLSGAGELLALEAELERLEHEMASGAQEVFDAYARAQARLEHAGGYRWREQAMAVVHGLGFSEADLDRRLASFSGGELTRGSLARALAAQPDLLLLDEPTNHLDIESLEWLEQTLTSLDAAVVLVAHDRWFLEAVGTAVLELEAGRARFFDGSWHAWRQESAARELALGRAIDRQQAEIARLERFVERFQAGTRARQAQSRAKRLAQIDRIEPTARDAKGLEFSFQAPERSGRVVFELEQGRLQVGERLLIDGAELWLERGEHVSLVGPNGSGKTTLVATLVGARELDGGRVRRGHNVKLGYLSQHAEELEARGARTVLEATTHQTGLTPNRARALLGRFLFSGEDAEKPLDGLSGGERRRLSLAILVHSGANVLILDEPTNHLDLDSREALEDALRAYEGSLLLVSHDRALLDAVGTRTVAIEQGTLRSYVGGWAEYMRVREQRRLAGDQALAPAPGPVPALVPKSRAPEPAGQRAGPASADGPKAISKNRRREAERAELAVEQAERALRDLEQELADPGAWATRYEAAKSEARHTAARRAVQQAYERLEAVAD
ncbi:MAG TPA: ATP-binding cassette domain-containing protein, partial [Solirubrobacteraceae bacterium]|nr:ATP-binding cassette domain-containing protein [Solirubrobacteraceae bacterium]